MTQLLFRVRAAGLTFSPTPILIRVIVPPVALIWNTEFKIRLLPSCPAIHWGEKGVGWGEGGEVCGWLGTCMMLLTSFSSARWLEKEIGRGYGSYEIMIVIVKASPSYWEYKSCVHVVCWSIYMIVSFVKQQQQQQQRKKTTKKNKNKEKICLPLESSSSSYMPSSWSKISWTRSGS